MHTCGERTVAVNLAIFDLDNTLIAGDSDTLWGEHLAALGAVSARLHARETRRFSRAYREGTLDIREYAAFQTRRLAGHRLEDLLRWREECLASRIRGLVLPAGQRLLREHRERRHTVVIVTASNRFVTEPIARLLGADHLIATEPEQRGGRFTGRVAGVPAFGEGKVTRLEQWLGADAASVESSWFYTDSHNDLPLLLRVAHPVAVDPDARLRREALQRGWPVISLRRQPRE